MRRSFSKNGLFGPRDFITDLKNRGVYQIFIIGMVFFGVTVVGLFIYFVLVPILAKDFQNVDDPTIIREYNNSGEVTVRHDMYDMVGEYLFKIRYINQPFMNGNEVICSGGMDTAGNPLLTRIYLYDVIKNGSDLEMSNFEIKSQYGNIFYPQVSENYIVYVDAKSLGGGGVICCYDRKAKTTKTVKEFYGATPEIHFAPEQNRIIWFEQVTGKIASVYVYDILLNKLATVATQYDMPFVYGGVGVDGNKIIWAGPIDSDETVDDVVASGKSQLFTMDLNTGIMDKFNPDMYAFSPKIKGNIIGWIDTNNSPTASLFVTWDGSAKKKLASSVTGYYIGEGYVVYCSEERMYCYFVEQDLTIPLSKQEKRTIMIGGNDGVVFWYDITQRDERDIVKYAKVDANSWRK
ncbi:MAG: hypothetical protein IJR47_04990 [Clostridia bacterium]|nr:hypothetical protein [Clostridia bacterium]